MELLSSFSRRQLVLRATLTDADHAEVRRCRGGHCRLGFAYQLGFVKLLGRLPNQYALPVLPELVTFMAIQAGEDEAKLDDYQQRRQTVAEHQERIRTHLALKRLDDLDVAKLETFIFEMACRLEHAADLQAKAREFLRERKVLLPADSKLVRIVGEHRERARQRIFAQLANSIPGPLAHSLDDLLVVDESSAVSPLQTIKNNPGKESASAMLSLLDKLSAIEATGVLDVDVSWLSRNYQRALFHYARQASAKRLRELSRSRRHATLVCFLWQSYGDAVDQAIDMFDKILTRTSARVQKRLDERMVKHRTLVRASMAALRRLGNVLLDESVDDAELRSRLFEQVSREDLADYVDGVQEWVSGRSSDPFVGFVQCHSTLRKFSPAFFRTLRFTSSGDVPSTCLEAVELLKELNENGRRKLPDDAPIDFVPQRLRRFVVIDGKVDKRAWECALMLRLRDEIRAGNVSVRRSKRFGPLDDFFMPAERWEAERERFFARAELPADPRQVVDFLGHRLGKAFDGFLGQAPREGLATVDGDGWHLPADPADRPDVERLAHLKDWFARRRRRVELTDLLIEVNNDLGFTRHFFGPGNVSANDTCTTLLAVLAHGCNLGSHKMSELARGVTYKQLKRVSDWQLTPEAQRAALATLTQGIASLDVTVHWGDGRTSASDGQRFAMPRKVLQQTYSTQFRDVALEIYTFVADNYAPFFSMPIECTDRDAAFVLDGLLYNESELELEEHYTDTHGYTEINFAAFAMLGRRFCPRIKGVKHQRIYRLDRERGYGALANLVGRADRTIDPRVIVEQWDRLGHLFASLESGCSTASVVLKRLVGYTGKNKIYRACRDLGRIFKTEFILDYMATPGLRTRVRRGLLKVEQLHALARTLFYGKGGSIGAREVREQMTSCSCLTLLLSCIIYWQAKEISRLAQQANPEVDDIDLSLLKHVSPIEWDNVVIYGRYHFNRSRIRGSKSKPSAQLTL